MDLNVIAQDNVLNALREALTGSSLEQHCYLVGGSVRDLLLGRPVSDYDLCVELPGGDLALARHLHSTGLISKPQKFKRHDLITCRVDNHKLEISHTLKKHSRGTNSCDDNYGTLSEDALSRDFTINTLYLYLADLTLWDPSGRGLHDLKDGMIAPVTTPQQCYEDDPLRMLRALRFSMDLGFGMEVYLMEAIKQMAKLICQIPVERVSDELLKMFKLSFSRTMDLAWDNGILGALSPSFGDSLQSLVDEGFKITDLCSCIEPSEDLTHIYSFFLWILITDVCELAETPQEVDEVELYIERNLIEIEKMLVIKLSDRKRLKALGMVFIYLLSHKNSLGKDLPRLFFISDLLGNDLVQLMEMLSLQFQHGSSDRVLIKDTITALERTDQMVSEHRFVLSGNDLLSMFGAKTKDYLGIVLLLLKLRWMQHPGINKDDLLKDVTKLLANPAIGEARLKLKNCRIKVRLLWDMESWKVLELI